MHLLQRKHGRRLPCQAHKQQGCERPIPGGPLSHMPARLVALVLILSFMSGNRTVEVPAAPLIIKGASQLMLIRMHHT
jgi:hypothetical protein